MEGYVITSYSIHYTKLYEYITDCDHDSIDIERKVFHDAGMNVTLCQAKSEEEVIRECGDGEILIVQYAHISEKVMEAMPQLKYIVRYGA